MRIPKEIVEKIEEKNRIEKEVQKWMNENIDTEGCNTYHPDIVNEPAGEPQGDGEWCAQSTIGIDTFCGDYYWETAVPGKYLKMSYFL